MYGRLYVSTVPTTVRDLLENPDLGLTLVVSGDLDREIRWVHVTELADPSPYLVGDEVILTAGVWRGRTTSALHFVRMLETRAVAGIAFGLLEHDEKVPPALVEACQQEGVPLLSVPVRTPFVAISQWFVERLSDERESELRSTLTFTSDLLEAADQADAALALGSVTERLSQETRRATWIANSDGRLITASGISMTSPAAAGAVEAVHSLARAFDEGITTVDTSTGEWTVRAITSGEGVSALLGVSGDGSRLVRARLDAATPVVALVLARRRAVIETERRLAGELIALILAGQEQMAVARLVAYGLDPQGALFAVVCVVNNRERALAGAEEWLRAVGRDGVVALRGDRLYAILDGLGGGEDPGQESASRALAGHLGADATGIGAVADAHTLRRSVVQAEQACGLALRRGGGTVFSYDLAGSHSLLLALQEPDIMETFRDALLEPIHQYDARNRTDLLRTLHTFLSSGGRWQQSAGDLNIHVNTLRNRLERVEQLTGRSLESMSDRVDLWLALQWERGSRLPADEVTKGRN